MTPRLSVPWRIAAVPRSVPAVALVLVIAIASLLRAQPGAPIDHKGAVSCLAWSGNGQWLATGAHDGTIRIREAATGKEVYNLSTGHPVAGMAFSPDGKTLAIRQTGQTMSTWDLATGKRLRVGGFPTYKADLLAFTPDGQTVVAAAFSEFVQWRVATGGATGSKSGVAGDGCAAVAPDGSLVGWSDSKGLVRLREYQPQNRQTTLQVGSARSIALGPGGKLLAVGDDRGVRLWDLPTQKETTTLTELKKPVAQLSLSADGHTLAALADDGTSLRIWDLKDRRPRRPINHPSKAAALALSPDGRLLATVGADGKAQLWNTLARELTHKGPALELSPKELAALWSDLGNAEAGKAEAAWQKLAGAGDNAVPFLQEQIRPIAVPSVDLKQLEKRLAELDADSFAVREKATAELIAAGEPAVGLLQRFLKQAPSLEARNRANIALAKLEEPALTPERLRVLEAIALLEQVRTARTIGLLKEIERDTLIPQIRTEARLALERLAQPPEKKP
jgi:WD40 repeat protein